MKTSRRDLWLMLVPVLILAGVGLSLRQRQGVVLKLGDDPFRVIIEGIRFERPTPREVYDGYDTKIAVDLGHKGKAPAWWGKQNGVMGGNSGSWSLNFSDNGKWRPVRDKQDEWVQPMRWQPAYDKTKDRYTARYLITLRHVPAGDEIRLRDRLAIEDQTGKSLSQPVWVDTVVRKRGQTTALPEVSHDQGFILERHEVDVVPPVETQNQAPQWRLRLFVRKIGRDYENHSVSGHFEMLDARGQHVSTLGTTGTDRTEMEAVHSRDLNKHQIVYHHFYFNPDSPPPAGPLWLVGKIGLGDKWPLPIRIPARGARGNILFTLRSAPLFRVISSTSGPADAFNVKENGADTTVKFVVQAIGKPAEPMRKWDWEAEYSQHVVDASGNRYWKFPLKGAQPAWPEYTFPDSTSANQVEVSYHLNLSKIPKSAGRLTFKAEISVDGSRRVPVSVVVRP